MRTQKYEKQLIVVFSMSLTGQAMVKYTHVKNTNTFTSASLAVILHLWGCFCMTMRKKNDIDDRLSPRFILIDWPVKLLTFESFDKVHMF